jgi:hypothetical protein
VFAAQTEPSELQTVHGSGVAHVILALASTLASPPDLSSTSGGSHTQVALVLSNGIVSRIFSHVTDYHPHV